MSIAIAVARATLDDLMRYDGNAELIGGRIVTYMATGFRPSRVAHLPSIGRLRRCDGARGGSE